MDAATVEIAKPALFEPYKSILTFPSAPEASTDHQGSIETNHDFDTEQLEPPWRRAVGYAFFSLNSELHADVETQLEQLSDADNTESEKYIGILERTFRDFACPAVGASQSVIDLAIGPSQIGGSWSLDAEPRRGQVDGDKEVTYHTMASTSTDVAVTKGSSTSSRAQ